jgi:photosystem II stability/assembly factor-like uncharacterized protein
VSNPTARRTGSAILHRLARPAVGALAACTVLLLAVASPAATRTAPGRFAGAGLQGSESATMQPVNLGVRAALVAAVPASPVEEAWAVGRSTAKVPGWAGESGGGQTVFLQYRRSHGWRMIGPPVSFTGALRNPKLTSIDITTGRIGWAVGDRGAMFRLEGDRWVEARSVTSRVLKSISLGGIGEDAYGWALGDGPTVFKLRSGTWSNGPPITVPSGESWELSKIAAATAHEAWAVGGAGAAVLILHGTDAGWSRVTTGTDLFDHDGPRKIGDTVVASTRAVGVDATADGAWLGGTIAPVDASTSLNDPAGDPTRPFILSLSRSGTVKSYCPDRYAMTSDGVATQAMCDEPFPLSSFGIADVKVLPNGGEIFAGGLGLFHFRHGSWFREPDPIGYVSSVSFATAREGWIAGPGDAFGAGGSFSTIGTIGHWTTRPQTPHMARWPQPHTDVANYLTQPLEAVATAPDGSGAALAVGRGAAAMLYRPKVGWDSLPVTGIHSFHAVAWPEAGRAWAVGGRGSIYTWEGSVWRQDPADRLLTTGSLFGLAFSSPGRGYAVGASGTILAYDGHRWSVDPASRRVTDSDLSAIAAAGREFVAVGADGTILETLDGVWHRVAGLAGLLDRGGQLPALYAVAGLPDGTALVGGELSTLLRRDGDTGSWRIDREGSRVPPEGTILALSARTRGPVIDIIASLTNEVLKYSGERPAPSSGFVLHSTSAGWEDVDFTTRYTIYAGFDASAALDPVLALASDGSGAWGVGGVAPGNDDGSGHAQAYPTSAIYRVEPGGDPRPALDSSDLAVNPAGSNVSFAFFGESGCGLGLCSPTMGTGARADVVASQIREEINAASHLSAGPRFAMFGGGMRRGGIPEEFGEFGRHADGFDVPMFAALGSRDLFRGLDAGSLNGATSGTGVDVQTDVTPSSSFYERSFAGRPAPWGSAQSKAGFVPISARSASGGRTHYAFDYAPAGDALLRVVVLDDSSSGRLNDANTQNPPEDQTQWAKDVLEDAQNRSIPSVIVMNRPPGNPLDVLTPRDVSVSTFLTALAQYQPSAVFTSYFRENAVELLDIGTVKLPIYIFGGGGAPLEAKPGTERDKPQPPDPFFGFYHSWQLVSVDLAQRDGNRAAVTVQSYPVVDTVSIHAVDGVHVRGGQTLRFTGTGHVPDGGSPDPLQSRASLIPFDFKNRGACPPDPLRGNLPRCIATGNVGPAFRYESSNPQVGYFVRPDRYNERLPELDAAGVPIPDASSGLFCAIGAGSTYVSVVSGFHRARALVTVTGGFGSCVKQPVVEPPQPPLPEPQPPLAKPAPHIPLGHFTATDNNAAAIVPPPPVPVVAPAPPAAGGFARREQHEEAREDAGQKFTALAPATRYDPEPAGQAIPLAAGGAFIALAAAVVAATLLPQRRGSIVRLTIEHPSGKREPR